MGDEVLRKFSKNNVMEMESIIKYLYGFVNTYGSINEAGEFGLRIVSSCII